MVINYLQIMLFGAVVLLTVKFELNVYLLLVSGSQETIKQEGNCSQRG